MRRVAYALIAFVVFSGAALADDPIPVIQLAEAVAAGSLEVPAADAYRIDLAGFTRPAGADRLVIQVQARPLSHYYSLDLPPGADAVLFAPGAVRASRGSPAFAGLHAGDDAFLLIGSEPSPGALDLGIFRDQATVWVSVAAPH